MSADKDKEELTRKAEELLSTVSGVAVAFGIFHDMYVRLREAEFTEKQSLFIIALVVSGSTLIEDGDSDDSSS